MLYKVHSKVALLIHINSANNKSKILSNTQKNLLVKYIITNFAFYHTHTGFIGSKFHTSGCPTCGIFEKLLFDHRNGGTEYGLGGSIWIFFVTTNSRASSKSKGSSFSSSSDDDSSDDTNLKLLFRNFFNNADSPNFFLVDGLSNDSIDFSSAGENAGPEVASNSSIPFDVALKKKSYFI